MPQVKTARGDFWIADHRGKSQAPAAVFIHGAGGSHLSFPAALRQLPSLAPLLVDLPGHGASVGPGRRSIADYALDIVALLDALALEQVVVLGHSMGGAIAQWLALEHAERISAAILAGTGARLRVNPALIAGVVARPEATISTVLRWMWSKQAAEELKQQSANIMLATDPTVIQGDFLACDSFDVSGRLAQIALPTLILAGEQDKMTPPALSQELERGIPNSELALLAQAGHMLLMEKPERSAELIDAWLKHALN